MIKFIEESTEYLQNKGFDNPEVGIILGTGLGQLINEIEIIAEASYNHTPLFSNCWLIQAKTVFGFTTEVVGEYTALLRCLETAGSMANNRSSPISSNGTPKVFPVSKITSSWGSSSPDRGTITFPHSSNGKSNSLQYAFRRFFPSIQSLAFRESGG